MPGCRMNVFYHNYLKIKFKTWKQKQRDGECADLVSGFFTLCKVADRKPASSCPRDRQQGLQKSSYRVQAVRSAAAISAMAEGMPSVTAPTSCWSLPPHGLPERGTSTPFHKFVHSLSVPGRVGTGHALSLRSWVHIYELVY